MSKQESNRPQRRERPFMCTVPTSDADDPVYGVIGLAFLIIVIAALARCAVGS